jgi:hypothetical protein
MIEESTLMDTIEYLGVGYEIETIAMVRQKFIDLELKSPYLVEVIQDDLLRLGELDDQLQTRLGVRKAELVEFAVVELAMSLVARTIQIIRRMGKKLDVAPDLENYLQMYEDLRGRSVVPLTVDKALA